MANRENVTQEPGGPTLAAARSSYQPESMLGGPSRLGIRADAWGVTGSAPSRGRDGVDPPGGVALNPRLRPVLVSPWQFAGVSRLLEVHKTVSGQKPMPIRSSVDQLEAEVPRRTPNNTARASVRAFHHNSQARLGQVDPSYHPGYKYARRQFAHIGQVRASAGGAALAFQKVGAQPEATRPDGPVPQQLHLDTTVPTTTDLDFQHERALALGARCSRTDRTTPAAPRVYADRPGHPF
jgi:hypothetical protein